jgi:hypothetical protein
MQTASATVGHDRRKLSERELLDELRTQGFSIEETKDGFRAKSPDGLGMSHFHLHNVGDWNRAYDNLVAQLRRIGFRLPGSQQGEAVVVQAPPQELVVDGRTIVRVEMSPPVHESWLALTRSDGITLKELETATGFPASTIRNHLQAFRVLRMLENRAGQGRGTEGQYFAIAPPGLLAERGKSTRAYFDDGESFGPMSVYHKPKKVQAPTPEQANGHAKPKRARSGPVRTRKLAPETPAAKVLAAAKAMQASLATLTDAAATIVEEAEALATENAETKARLRKIEDKLDDLVGAL